MFVRQLFARQGLFGLLCALALVVLPMLARTTYAHAVITRSEPAANAVLTEPPSEIRLWFTEPLEPTYSTFELRDATGAVVSTPPSYVDPSDDHLLVMQPGELPDGPYTVVWRNVSSADGHRIAGSFPFIIGAAGTVVAPESAPEVELAPLDLISRWVNLMGLALAVGGIAFVVFVWQPSMRTHSQTTPQPLWGMVWLGWWVAGIGAVLLLLNQTAILLNEPLIRVLVADKIIGVISDTRFGTLWIARMALWAVMGVLLVAARRSTLLAWLATGCGLLMLLPTSLNSHAAVSNDLALSVFSDWIHLTMTALWIGGLVQLFVAISAMRALAQSIVAMLGKLVAYFSNYVRIAVAGLIITGIYAIWHQVNTIEALTTTFYGQLLSLKLILALVLLVVAAINLVWTQRRLLDGQALWIGRLRGLVGLEVLLVVAILLVVGAMTSVNPARNEIVQREIAAAVPPPPEPQPIMAMEMVDDIHVHMMASPGWVGVNTFSIQLADEHGEPITDASMIRMRFEHETEKLGESEMQMRPEAESPDGLYVMEGANLSTVGEWRARMTIQRPDEFDSVVDLSLAVAAPPTPAPAPVVDANPMPPYRVPILWAVGAMALLAGITFLTQQRFRLWQGTGLLASLLVILGIAFLLTGALS